MLEARVTVSKCDKCQQENIFSLKYFVGIDYKFEKSIVATCQACNSDFIAKFDESTIR